MWDKHQQRLFITKLTECEECKDRLDGHDLAYIRNMRSKYDSREISIHLGLEIWEPTVRQINYLESIAASLHD